MEAREFRHLRFLLELAEGDVQDDDGWVAHMVRSLLMEPETRLNAGPFALAVRQIAALGTARPPRGVFLDILIGIIPRS